MNVSSNFCLTIEAYLSHSYATYCNILQHIATLFCQQITPRLRNEWIETTNKNGLKQQASYWTYNEQNRMRCWIEVSSVSQRNPSAWTRPTIEDILGIIHLRMTQTMQNDTYINIYQHACTPGGSTPASGKKVDVTPCDHQDICP